MAFLDDARHVLTPWRRRFHRLEFSVTDTVMHTVQCGNHFRRPTLFVDRISVNHPNFGCAYLWLVFAYSKLLARLLVGLDQPLRQDSSSSPNVSETWPMENEISRI